MSQPTLKMTWQHSAPAEPPQLFTAHANLRLHSNSCHDTLHVITDSIPAAIQCDDCTVGVMLNFADWAVTVDLLVEVLGDVLHQGTQGTVQDQIALTCQDTGLIKDSKQCVQLCRIVATTRAIVIMVTNS